MAARGWYDNTAVQLSTTEHIPNSVSSIQYTFMQGATSPTAGSTMRKTFPPSDSVYLGYWEKHSTNWVGSQQTYHPHEFHFLTNLDGVWAGLSFDHLTTYIEENGGTPLIGIQDGTNVDQTKIGVNLTAVTEQRGVAGCNGSSDGYADNCYLASSGYVNEKKWRAAAPYFTDSPGAFYKADWHFVEAFVKMNSIAGGKGTSGIVQYWFVSSSSSVTTSAPPAGERSPGRSGVSRIRCRRPRRQAWIDNPSVREQTLVPSRQPAQWASPLCSMLVITGLLPVHGLGLADDDRSLERTRGSGSSISIDSLRRDKTHAGSPSKSSLPATRSTSLLRSVRENWNRLSEGVSPMSSTC